MMYQNCTSKFTVSRKNIHLRFSKHYWKCPILVKLQGKIRSSRPEVFYKEGVLENFANFT